MSDLLPSDSTSSSRSNIFSHPFGVQWRKALVSAPRLVPLAALKYTSSEGPHPFILNLPSRGKYSIPIYVFVPPDPAPEHSAHGLPVVLDFHGGGFVLGSCLEQGPFCAKLARELGAVVLCVDYRMGPVDKFPAAIEDGEDVLSAVLDENARGGKELREAVSSRLSSDAKKTLKRARKQEKRDARTQRKAEKKEARAQRGGGGLLRPTLGRNNTTTTGTQRPTMSRTNTGSSVASTRSVSRGSSPLSRSASTNKLSRTNTGLSAYSVASASSSDENLPNVCILDTTRIALSGFSSGGNLILNLALSCSPSSETVPPIPTNWPSRFPASYPGKIPLLLYYPSFDVRPLPSERPNPKGLEPGGGFWSDANDMLMPTYVPRMWASHPRASPGLADLGAPPPRDYHPDSPDDSKENFGANQNVKIAPRMPSAASGLGEKLETGAATEQNAHPTSDPRSNPTEAAQKSSEAAGAASQAEGHFNAVPGPTSNPTAPTNITSNPTSDPAAASARSLASSSGHDNVPPPGLHPAAKCQLILPVLDSLSQQSEVWIEAVRQSGRSIAEWPLPSSLEGTGWNEYPDPETSVPTSTTEGKSKDKPKDKDKGGKSAALTAASRAAAYVRMPRHEWEKDPYPEPNTDVDLEVLRYPGMKHGWTQMPEGWLSAEERKTRLDCFDKSVRYVRKIWEEREMRERRETVREVEKEEELIGRVKTGSGGASSPASLSGEESA